MNFRTKDLMITLTPKEALDPAGPVHCLSPSRLTFCPLPSVCSPCSVVVSCGPCSTEPTFVTCQWGSIPPLTTVVTCGGTIRCGGSMTPVLEINTLDELKALKAQVRQELGIEEGPSTLAEAEVLATRLSEAQAELEVRIAELKKQP